MLSYQHIYHAGNFADVHKHALLVRVLAALKVKHPRLCIVDTHAGRGLYDLSSDEAQKTGESANGIAKMRDLTGTPVEDYLGLVRKYDGAYPGSAAIAKDMLRPGDRLVLAELHPGELAELQKSISGHNVSIMKKDGLEVMAEALPPPERRGLAVIDPSYEIKTEYTDLPRKIHNVYKKWPQGVFFIWYPVLTAQPHLRMLTALRKTGISNILVSEMKMGKMPDEGFAMHGTGIAIINPPLPEQAVDAVSRFVADALGAKQETYWLANRMIDPETGLIAL